MAPTAHTIQVPFMLQPLFRPRDQVTLVTLLAVLLAVFAVAWVAGGGFTPQTIDIDRAEPLEYPFLVDVNSAEWPELSQLPDVGEVLARRIVETRKSRGRFLSSEELMEVEGIGPRKLARIAPYLAPLPETRTIAGN
jgi:competence protein ComEA